VSATLLDTTAVRARFTALQRRLAFFDGPGGTQCPDEVIDAIAEYLRHDNANVGGPFPTSRRSSALVDLAHEKAGSFLGCSGDEVAFGQSMTSLNFLLTRALARELQAGDEVLVTKLDHDGNVAPWLALQEDLGIVVRRIDVHEDLSLDYDSLASQLNDRTRVVAFTVAANSVGTAPDVRRIVDLAHGAGALAWADAVHYGPHGPIDVAAWDVDVLLCSPYKFYGPHMGMAYGKQDLLASWRPYKVRPAANDPVGHRYELGTCQHELLAGFVAAVDYIDSIGWEPIVVTTDRFGSGDGRSGERVVRTGEFLRRSSAPRGRAGRGAESRPARGGGLRRGFLRFVEKWLLVPDKHVRWTLMAFAPALGILKSAEADAIYTSSPPVSAHVLGRLLKRLTGRPWTR